MVFCEWLLNHAQVDSSPLCLIGSGSEWAVCCSAHLFLIFVCLAFKSQIEATWMQNRLFFFFFFTFVTISHSQNCINAIDKIFGQSIKHYRPAVCDDGMLFVFVQPIVHSLFELAGLMV